MHFEHLKPSHNYLYIKLMEGDLVQQTSQGTILRDIEEIDDEIIEQQQDAVARYVSNNSKIIDYLNAKSKEALALIGK